MFGRTAAAVAVAALASVGGGCGTLINQSNEPGQAFYSDQFPPQVPYGGVLRDLAAPPAGIWQAATTENDPGLWGRTQMVAAAVFIPPLDLPFSLLGDTLFLPFDLAHTLGMGGAKPADQPGGAAPAPTAGAKPQEPAAAK